MTDYKPLCRVTRDPTDVFDLIQRVSTALRSNGEDDAAEKVEREVIDKANNHEKAIKICQKYVNIKYVSGPKPRKSNDKHR